MELKYDPAQGEQFWAAVREIPGFPTGDEIPLRTMLIESDALFRLPEVLNSLHPGDGRDVLVVMDPTPMRRGGDSLKPLLLQVLRDAGWKPRALVLEPDASGQVHTDMPQIETVKANIQHGVPLLSVGSGVVTDISKHACYLYEKENGWHVPFLVYQTANSVSAYTSSMAPVFIQGVKRTLSSRYPEAVLCDLETLCDAPYEMTAAGVGDMLAVFVSFPDWYLAHRLGMDDSYTRLPEALIGPLDQILIEAAGEIRNRSLRGMAVLAKLISLGGLAMSLSHATTPLSGYEHVMSHILDLINELQARPLPMHGSQVALTSVLGAEAYRIFLQRFSPHSLHLPDCFPDPERMRTHILNAFLEIDPSGKAGEECWGDYRIKLEGWNRYPEKVGQFLGEWGAIQAEIAALASPPETIFKILRAVEAPCAFAELQPPIDEKEARFAFLNAPLMRKRLTVGDALIFFGFNRETLWAQVWGVAQAGAGSPKTNP